MKIVILLATYNGARFIEEQIKTIQLQTYKDWSLFIRDDGSKDNTVNIVRSIAATDPRITLMDDGLGNIGVIRNFEQLMQKAAAADYIAFSDQDDAWKPEKLQVMINAMKQTETDNTIPVLVHCDLEVVGEHLQPIHPSFMACRKIDPFHPRLEAVLCQNIVTGCTCFINQALLKLALPMPKAVLMHDWWLALLAFSCGKVGYVDQTLVRYRQHGQNVVGVSSRFARLIHWLTRSQKNKPSFTQYVRSTVEQACILKERVQAAAVKPSTAHLQVIERYCGCIQMPLAERIRTLMGFTIVKRSLLADIIFKFSLLRL